MFNRLSFHAVFAGSNRSEIVRKRNATTINVPRWIALGTMLYAWTNVCFSAPNESTSPAASTLDSGSASLRENQFSGNALNGQALQETYGGIVTDQTITVAGQTFYQSFVAAWHDKPNQERFVLAVRERPSARWGNEVWIEYAQRRVFQAVLPPNRSNIKAVVDQAVEIAYKNVADAEVQRLLFREPDIGPDEF